MALDLKHQTAAQFAGRFWARVRQAYQSGDKQTFHRLIAWVYARVQAGDLTSDQVRLSFNAAYDRSLTSAQWNTLVQNRLIPIAQRYAELQAEEDL